MSGKRFRASDFGFFFGGPMGCSRQDEVDWNICAICGKRFCDHGLGVWLETSFVPGVYVGNLCGGCLTSDPKRLAKLARERAPILREKRPRRGDDEDTNIRWADHLHRFADLADTMDGLHVIPGGTLAVKIGEGYLDLDNPTKARKGKAA